MANATALTINELTANSWVDNSTLTGDVLDTGTVAVTIYGTVDTKKTDRIIVRVANGGSALTVAALAGDDPPAFRAGLGNATASIANGSVGWFGPFESARFQQNDGTFGITFTPSAGTVAGTIHVIALPAV